MSIEIEIGKYSDTKDLGGFQKMEFSSIDEAISNLEFLKLGYNYFKNGESLVVRIEKGSKPYLIDFDSVIPIQELRRELDEKYNNKEITEDDEIEFTITEKPQKTHLNSNFEFDEDQNTIYAKTTTGESLPFKLFKADDNDTRSNLLWESPNSAESSDFALVERRFSENNSLQFFGAEKIEGLNDVAWLFRSLEDEAVEHAFLVYDFEDKGYFIQHISTGTFDAALIDNRQIIGNVIEANPKSVTLVHNHPSGNLKASNADVNVLSVLKKALQNTDVTVNDGVIINLRSGNYLVFNDKKYSEKIERIEDSKKLENIQAYSFSKQVFVQNFQPIRVNSPEDVAAYITSQKFGISDKHEMLVLNTQLNIVGKFILPTNNQENFIIEKVSKFGGTSCVLYGNNITPELIEFYSKRLGNSNITITDAILLKSENGQKLWESFMLENKMQKNNNGDTLHLNENIQPIVTIMANELSWSDRVMTPLSKEYKDFINNMKNTSPERWHRDGEREFTDREKKFMQIYNYKNGIKEPTLLEISLKGKEMGFTNIQKGLIFLEKLSANADNILFKNNMLRFETLIVNNAEKYKLISDFWAREHTQRTPLSDNMTNNEIDEKQSHFYRKYEIEAKKIGVEVIPFNKVESKIEIQMKALELADYLNGGDNILVLDGSVPKSAMSSTQIHSLQSLIENLEKHFIPEGVNKSISIRFFGEHNTPIFHTTSMDLKNDLTFELKNIQENIRDNNTNKHINIMESNKIELLAENLKRHYEIKDEGGWNFNNPEIIDILKAAVEISKMSEKLKETVLSYMTINPPQHPQIEDFRDDSFDRGETDYNKSLENYRTKAEPEFSNKISTMNKLLAENNIDVDKLPILGELEAYEFKYLVNDLELNFSKDIKEINSNYLSIMENKKDFDQLKYLKDQLKYLGFGEDEKLHKALEIGVSSTETKFQIQTISDKALPGNSVDFTINFGKSEQGGVFLNSYDANLTNGKGESISQNFKVNKDNSFTAKEAVNLLEGRSVKIEFVNPKTEQREQAFVKLNLSEEKNQYGNYDFQSFHQNYGVDAKQIVEKSNLIFDKPEFKDSAIKSLEKGNVVKVKFEMDDKAIEGKAVLNPQYKTINLYDSDMNRINTNKPLQGIDQDNSHQKANVREQSVSRGI